MINMNRVSPHFFIILFIAGYTVFVLINILDFANLYDVPDWFYRLVFGSIAFFFLWWPMSLLVYWEKRTNRERIKDTVLLLILTCFILLFYPYYYFATPFLPTLGVAFLVGLVLPLVGIYFYTRKERKITIDPYDIYKLVMKDEERVQEFLHFFPKARKYVIGLSPADGDRIHFILHHRQRFQEIEQNVMIDYVLDISIDRRLGIVLGRSEELQCYLFYNENGRARIGFLPSSNIGRALDYGFSESEIDRALEQLEDENQRWPPLSEEPLRVQHYPGKKVEIR